MKKNNLYVKFYIFSLVTISLIILISNINIVSARSKVNTQVYTDTSSDEPYFCYGNSPYHCNSYKPFVNGDYCAKYCDDLVAKKRFPGNKGDNIYNCMMKCVYGPDGGKIYFKKRMNGEKGLGLNYKF
jgi:hypothetical protein